MVWALAPPNLTKYLLAENVMQDYFLKEVG